MELLGNHYDVAIEKLPGTAKHRVSGSVMGELLQIERRGYNAALAGWRVAANQKLNDERPTPTVRLDGLPEGALMSDEKCSVSNCNKTAAMEALVRDGDGKYSDKRRQHQPLLCAHHVFHDKDRDTVFRLL